MSAKKRPDFKASAGAYGGAPSSMSSMLDNIKQRQTGEAGAKGNEIGLEVLRATTNPPATKPGVRQNLYLPADLDQRLRDYCHDTRRTKTATIILALEKFFDAGEEAGEGLAE